MSYCRTVCHYTVPVKAFIKGNQIVRMNFNEVSNLFIRIFQNSQNVFQNSQFLEVSLHEDVSVYWSVRPRVRPSAMLFELRKLMEN